MFFINTKKRKQLLVSDTKEIPKKWHKKIPCDLKLKKLSRQYEDKLREIKLGEYRDRRQVDWQMRKARIRKLIRAGEIIEQAGLLDFITGTDSDTAVARIKSMLKEDDLFGGQT